jgi:hypothetical protein
MNPLAYFWQSTKTVCEVRDGNLESWAEPKFAAACAVISGGTAVWSGIDAAKDMYAAIYSNASTEVKQALMQRAAINGGIALVAGLMCYVVL